MPSPPRILGRVLLLGIVALVIGCGSAGRVGQHHAVTSTPAASTSSAVDLSLVQEAFNTLLKLAIEQPHSDTLLGGAWDGLTAESGREGLQVDQSARPRLTGVTQSDFRAFSTAVDRLSQRPAPHLDGTRLTYAAIDGMTKVLDDTHTTFLPPATYDAEQRREAGNLGTATGLRLEYETEHPATVLEVVPNSAAARAGIKPGDIVAELNGRAIQAFSPREVSRQLEGPDGSRLQLQVRGAGSARSHSVTIVRQTMPLDLVHSTVLPGNVGYIRIREFPSQARIQLQARQALDDFEYNHTNGVIVDLRGNPGGSFGTLQPVASLLISQSPLAYATGRDGISHPLARSGAFSFHQRLVLLVDQGSASSSEIIASAVQEYKDGLLVGVRTCGCLMEATIVGLPGSKAALEIAIARVLSPVQEVQIEHAGITPDVNVSEDPRTLAQGRDVQVEAALRALGVDQSTAQKATIAVVEGGS